MQYIFTMEYYSVINKKETLPFATIQINLNQAKKDKYCMMSYMWNLKVKLREPESRTVVPGTGGQGKGQSKVTNFNYKINKFWGSMYSLVTIVNHTTLHYLKFAKKV